MKWGWMFILAVFCLSSCGKGENQLPIKEETFVKVLADLHLAEAIIQDSPVRSRKDSLYQSYYERVFVQNGVTKEDFDQTMGTVRRDPKKLKEIYSLVLDELSRRDANLK